MRTLLEVAPATALSKDSEGWLPLHFAAEGGSAEAVCLLLEVAPAAALMSTTTHAAGSLPLHIAVWHGHAAVVRLLLEAAPAAALAESKDGLPLKVALDQAADPWDDDFQDYLESARLLLPATPPEYALSALLEASEVEAGEAALPLFADLAACTALSPGQWQRVPGPCPALAAALPAVLARSAAEAALLVGRLPAEVRQRLRTGALCLARAQRKHHAELPAVLLGQVLALAAEPGTGTF